ncbi:MAG: GIY-YIG nuclease family protein [Candidatus Parcubacteria bacterium]|nr:GIY-YIG nuclease family protein [Candidatus Parcubacteria bacterium]
MYYTYVLLSRKDGEFYIGFTSDLTNRLNLHKSGKVNSTSCRLPVILIYYECCLNKTDAIRREKYLKTGPGGRYLKKRLKFQLNS